MNVRLLRRVLAMLVLLVATLAAVKAQPAPPSSAPAAKPVASLSAAQLDQLLAPIALYPDPLLGQILMASTYPLEVVEAARWLQDPRNAAIKGDQLVAALRNQDWDPSVKSLVPFPQVLRMMDSRLDWLQQVGDAFLAQQGDVMDSVQRLRRRAQGAGTLKSSPQQTVTDEDQTIAIEPASPDVVYVPVYDPTLIYGAWPYPDYPPFYFAMPGVILGPPWFPGWWWGPAIEIGLFAPFWGWDHWDWRHHELHIDRDGFARLGGAGHPIGAGGIWEHDPYHRRGVAYRSIEVRQRFAPAGAATPSADRSFRGFSGTAAPDGTARTAPSIQRGTIFDRSGTGADARAHSERGHASQQSLPSAPPAGSGVSRGVTPSGGRSFSGGGGFGGRSNRR